MLVEKVITANSIHDLKLIGENDLERQFIKQLAEAGTLTCVNREVSSEVLFRAISVDSELSSYTSDDSKVIGKYDFTVRQNEDFTRDFTFEENGLAMNLTAYTGIKIQIKQRKNTSPIIELTLGSGLAISGVGNNILVMKIAAAQTKLLSCDVYYYDVLLSKPTSNRYFMEGKLTVKNTITR